MYLAITCEAHLLLSLSSLLLRRLGRLSASYDREKVQCAVPDREAIESLRNKAG